MAIQVLSKHSSSLYTLLTGVIRLFINAGTENLESFHVADIERRNLSECLPNVCGVEEDIKGSLAIIVG